MRRAATSSKLIISPLPDIGQAFTFDRARRLHCVAYQQMPIAEGSGEAVYFGKVVAEVLHVLDGVQLPPAMEPMLESFRKGERLLPFSMSYAQLQQVQDAPFQLRQPPKNEEGWVPVNEFDVFSVAEQQYVQMLDGKFYKLCTQLYWRRKAELVCMVGEQCFSIGLQSKLIVVKAGRWLFDCFHELAGDCKFLFKDGQLHDQLFVDWFKKPFHSLQAMISEARESPVSSPREEQSEAFPEDEQMTLEQLANVNESSCKYVLQNKSNCFSMFAANAKNEPTWIRCANFELVTLMAVYNYVNSSDSDSVQRVLVRQVVNPDGNGTLRVIPDSDKRQHQRAPKSEQYVEVEVLLKSQTYNRSSEISTAFSNQYGTLMSELITPEMLKVWISSEYIRQGNDLAKYTLIDHWGRQPSMEAANECMFVMSNTVLRKRYKDGKSTVSFEPLNRLTYMPSHFSQCLLPMQPDEFPRAVVIKAPWVRFKIASMLFADYLPGEFLENQMPAFAAICMSIMGIKAPEIWKDQHGTRSGMPLAWLYSTQHATGKTTTVCTINSLLGFSQMGSKRGILNGDITKAALIERASQQCGMSIIADDFVAYKDNQSFKLAELFRLLYDGTSRAVMQKTRWPRSSVIYTSNNLVNMTDEAFQSRLLIFHFQTRTQLPASNSTRSFMKLCELCSSLIGDFSSLTHEGKLDHEAIADCAYYCGFLVNKIRDRSASNWGLLLYFMLLLNKLFNTALEQTILEWTSLQLTTNVVPLNQSQLMLDKLIIATYQMLHLQPNLAESDRCLSVHNFRQNVLHHADHYTVLRLDHVLAVLIKSGLSKREIEVECRTMNDIAFFGRHYFYDTKKRPFPVYKFEMDPLTATMLKVPLLESEYTQDSMSRFCCMFIRQAYYNRIVKDYEEPTTLATSYDNVLVPSANAEWGPYNFAEGIQQEEWFGYRALNECTFANYCGARGKMLPSLNTDVVDHHLEKGFSTDIHQFFTVETLYNFYCTEQQGPTPPCYSQNPFENINRDDFESLFSESEPEPVMAEAESDQRESRYVTPMKPPGSNPAKRSSHTTGRRRKRCKFIEDEASDEDGSDDEEVLPY